MIRNGYNITIALESIQANKVKSILTALGIIFGVSAVISMLAIGNGAQKEILDQMKQVGVNNIMIHPVLPDQTINENSNNKNNNKFSPGLSLADAKALAVIPSIKTVCPLINQTTFIVQGGVRKQANLQGVNNKYFSLFNLDILEGSDFNPFQEEHGLPVCIISTGIKNRFFGSKNPIGQKIKCGQVWLTIVGVSMPGYISKNTAGNNTDIIYIPIKTMLLRFENRALITQRNFAKSEDEDESDKKETTKPNYHQLDQIVVQVIETNQIETTVELLKRVLYRRHSKVDDFEITVPELLLKQQQRTKDIFNIVLGAIAAISLVVGGIGIMNIMLASVMERIKEIGIRRAMGATRKDIVFQFVAESTLISTMGGFIGIFLGYLLSALVTKFAGILTIVSFSSVLVAFGISAAVGISFGIMPAKKAAVQDPVVSLRTE